MYPASLSVGARNGAGQTTCTLSRGRGGVCGEVWPVSSTVFLNQGMGITESKT